MGTNLITKAEYKAYVGINSTNEDAKIELLCTKVSDFIKQHCKQSFIDNVDEAKVQKFSGGQLKFSLSEYPVISATVEYSTDYGQTYTPLVEYTDYIVSPEDGYIISTATTGFPYLLNGYKVSYTCGYETVPESLKLAVFDMVTYYMKNDSAVHSNKAPGSNTVQIEYIKTNSLPANISRVLDFYTADYL